MSSFENCRQKGTENRPRYKTVLKLCPAEMLDKPVGGARKLVVGDCTSRLRTFEIAWFLGTSFYDMFARPINCDEIFPRNRIFDLFFNLNDSLVISRVRTV
jgi:hypothetical protein